MSAIRMRLEGLLDAAMAAAPLVPREAAGSRPALTPPTTDPQVDHLHAVLGAIARHGRRA